MSTPSEPTPAAPPTHRWWDTGGRRGRRSRSTSANATARGACRCWSSQTWASTCPSWAAAISHDSVAARPDSASLTSRSGVTSTSPPSSVTPSASATPHGPTRHARWWCSTQHGPQQPHPLPVQLLHPQHPPLNAWTSRLNMLAVCLHSTPGCICPGSHVRRWWVCAQSGDPAGSGR